MGQTVADGAGDVAVSTVSVSQGWQSEAAGGIRQWPRWQLAADDGGWQ